MIVERTCGSLTPVSRILRLLCILAHPDDESIGLGGTLAKYGAEGVRTYVLLATRGERGRDGTVSGTPGAEPVGRKREREARAAASILGVRAMWFLGCPDGAVDSAVPNVVVEAMVDRIRKVRPQVVITFPPDGCDGHPDHVAVSRLAATAVARAAPEHAVAKLYYLVLPRAARRGLDRALAPPRGRTAGSGRNVPPWPEWLVTTRIDATAFWRTAWEAVWCHRSQMAGRPTFAGLDEDRCREIWGHQCFYRVFSLVTVGRETETDLFTGLRGDETAAVPLPDGRSSAAALRRSRLPAAP